jgi:alanine dehydrogenase
MHIAIPRPSQADEQRIALTPAGVQTLVGAGHTVYVESGAGIGAGFADSAFGAIGATIVYSSEEIYARGDLILTVNGVPAAAFRHLRRGQLLCGFLPLAVLPGRTLDALCAAGVSTLSYDMIRRDGGARPVLLPMSEIAGRLLPQLAGRLLETPSGGRGTLLAPIPGVPSAEVVILGAGTVGVNAAYGLTSVGVQTTVLDQDVERLRFCERICRGRVTTRLCTTSAIEHVLPFADVLIGAVHHPSGRAPMLVSQGLVRTMKPRSVIIDVSIDEGGCVATSRPTTHHDPTYIAEGVLHYAVPNIPSAVARTAAHALNNALLPYIEAIAGIGLERAGAADQALARGISLLGGRPATEQVAALLGKTTSQTTATQLEPI